MPQILISNSCCKKIYIYSHEASYLRLFENFNEYYKEVTKIEATKFDRGRKRVKFTDRQIEIIRENSGSHALYIFEHRFVIQVGAPSPQFYILSYDDEYYRCFLLNSDNEFLCDGFDGLIKFIEDFIDGRFHIAFVYNM